MGWGTAGAVSSENRTAKHSGKPLKTKIWSAYEPPKSLGLASIALKVFRRDRPGSAPSRELQLEFCHMALQFSLPAEPTSITLKELFSAYLSSKKRVVGKMGQIKNIFRDLVPFNLKKCKPRR